MESVQYHNDGFCLTHHFILDTIMEIERSLEPLTVDDLKELYVGSIKRLREYFVLGRGIKWKDLYSIEKPLAAALCQGGAMHYYDLRNGIKDFDVWFFYPFKEKHLPVSNDLELGLPKP